MKFIPTAYFCFLTENIVEYVIDPLQKAMISNLTFECEYLQQFLSLFFHFVNK